MTVFVYRASLDRTKRNQAIECQVLNAERISDFMRKLENFRVRNQR
jgi:hypothetical protein